MSEQAFLNPEEVMKNFSIDRGASVADFGSGSGFWATPLARKVGPEGKVYAFDIRQQAVEAVRSRAALEKLYQVESIMADLEEPHGSRLKDNTCDFILLSAIMHQAENKGAMLTEALRILKPGHQMAVIDWKEHALGGPPVSLRLPPEKALMAAQEAGFIFEKEFDAGSFHYGLLLKKR